MTFARTTSTEDRRRTHLARYLTRSMSSKRTTSKPRRKNTDVVVSLDVTGESTEVWCAEVAQLLVDLVGPWQVLVSGGGDGEHNEGTSTTDQDRGREGL